MRSRAALFAIVAGLALVISQSATGIAATKGGDAPVQFLRETFTGGTREGVAAGAPLTLASTGLSTGTYTDPFGSALISYQSGSWTSDWTAVPFAFDELVASWNATTPATTWIRVEMQARGTGRPETRWYTMQVWASGDEDIHRTSVNGQGTTDGFIATDTFIRSRKAAPLNSYRLRVTLYRKTGSAATPSVRFLGAMTSAAFKYQIPSSFTGGQPDLNVPKLSQELHTGHFPQYDSGGEAWCSPTSTAMVLRFWGVGPTEAQLAVFPGPDADGTAHADGDVDYAARYVYDYTYQGAGNWPNNTAYAATFGLEGFVTRLRSLSEAQLFIEAGIPLVASINGSLHGFGKTNGHLLVIRGFTATGDVITNDPAVLSNDEAMKMYGRKDFEDVWLGGSAGIVYVIHPVGVTLPPNVAGVPNW